MKGEPQVNMQHKDGALLTCSDGASYRLTLWEALLFNLGFTDAKKLENKIRKLNDS